MISRIILSLPYQLIVILYVVFECLRNKKNFRSSISQRFGIGGIATARSIWIHSASLGEVRGVVPFVNALIKKHPETSLMFTTTSLTGLNEIRKEFPNAYSSLLPLDLGPIISRYLKKHKPRLLIINETEIWPQLIIQAKRISIPIAFINGRISDEVYSNYLRLKFIFSTLVSKADLILAQTPLDAERFISLGANSKVVSVAGNTKFDTNISLICAEVLKYYSALKDYSELIVTFGSVREEEEEIVLNAIDLVSANFKGVTFIAVPRYQERFLPFFYKLKQINSNTVLRSDNLVQSKTTVDDNKIVLVDKIGELLAAYQVSNLAFVGGTYSDVGGHNILEPAYFSVPIIIGPKMETQRLAYDALKKKEGIVIIEDHNQLGTQIVSLLENRQELLNKGVNAHSAYLELKGSSALILEKLQSFINK